MLNRGGEGFGEEVGEHFREAVAKIDVVWRIVSEGDANRAGESFGGEWFVESAGEEGIPGWIGG